MYVRVYARYTLTLVVAQSYRAQGKRGQAEEGTAEKRAARQREEREMGAEGAGRLCSLSGAFEGSRDHGRGPGPPHHPGNHRDRKGENTEYDRPAGQVGRAPSR